MDFGTTKMIARKEGGIGWMIFNQPEKHNAVSLDMWAAVPRIIAAFEADPEVRVIVLARRRRAGLRLGRRHLRVRAASAAPRTPSGSTTRVGDAADAALAAAPPSPPSP